MLRTRPEQPRGACLALFLLGCVVQSTRALPQLDPVHTHMESPPPKVQRPHVRSPFARSVISPKRVTALVPAACVGLRFFAPALSTKIFFHLICFLGALFEPFEMVLPKRSLLLGFIHQMRDARNAYDDKHGIPRMQQQFFEEEEEEGGGVGGAAADGADAGADAEEEEAQEEEAQEEAETDEGAADNEDDAVAAEDEG